MTDISYSLDLTNIPKQPLYTPLAVLLFHVVNLDKADFLAPLVAFFAYQIDNCVVFYPAEGTCSFVLETPHHQATTMEEVSATGLYVQPVS